MKNLIIIVFCLLLPCFLKAQGTATQTKYEILSYLRNDNLTKIEFDYFYTEKPIERIKPYSTADSTEETIDLETYETLKIHSEKYDSVYQIRQAEYQDEMEIWQKGQNLNQKIMLVSEPWSYKMENLINRTGVEGFENLVNKLSQSKFLAWEAEKIENKTPYLLLNLRYADTQQLKYSIVGYWMLSDIVLNENQDKAVLVMGLYYMIKNGKTGFGDLLILTKKQVLGR